MNETQLALELAEIHIPGGDAALDRCVAAYRGDPRVVSVPEPRRRMPAMRFRLAAVAVIAAGIVAFSLTPPGRAATGWVADLIGIAEVGEAPTVPPAPIEGFESRAPRATVIASGLTARGDPFEWVLEGDERRGTCLWLLYPARRSSDGEGRCGENLFLPLRGRDILSWGSLLTGQEPSITGFVSPAVASVKLTFQRDGEVETLDAVTEQVALRLLRKAGANRPRGVFIAFLPPGSSHVTATAYDAQGTALASINYHWPAGL